MLLEPAPESEYLGHGSHMELDIAPIAAEKVSSGQSRQADEACSDLYLPGLQAEHVEPFTT
jgi:hypothetical protein